LQSPVRRERGGGVSSSSSPFSGKGATLDVRGPRARPTASALLATLAVHSSCPDLAARATQVRQTDEHPESPVQRFVFTSSIAAFGSVADPSELPMTEVRGPPGHTIQPGHGSALHMRA